MAVVNGASVNQESGNPTHIRYDVIGFSTTTFAVGDLVTVNGGYMQVLGGTGAGTTLTCWGVAQKAFTTTATNANAAGAKVAIPYIPALDTTVFLMGTNSDLTGNTTNVGQFYGVTGTTGVMQVDVTLGVLTGASRVVEIVKVDPFGDGGTGSGSGVRKVLVKIVKTPSSNYNITA